MTTSMLASGSVATGPELAKAPSGIAGLDEVTGGGLPANRVTLITGGAGAGKTLLGIEFLVNGVRRFGEPGVLLTFEESQAKVTADVRSLGFDLPGLERSGQLVLQSFQVDPAQIVATGEFDFEPLFLILDQAIERIGAKRVLLDTVEVLFGAFGDDAIVRAEVARLMRWLEDRGVTAIVTGERGPGESLTRHGIEEYVSDCVIVLDHRVRDQISTRRLRIVKYRGSLHGTNEYPFVISGSGISVLPITSIGLAYAVSDERVSTGIRHLDHMLGDGVFRGSTILVSGTAGTGKTSFGACVAAAACASGERAMMVLFEESPDQVMRNMASIGLDLRRWADAGLLYFWAARPTSFGMESILAGLATAIEESTPSVAILDGIAAFTPGTSAPEASWALARMIDLAKARGITCVTTLLGHGDEDSHMSLSSLMDTWLLLRNVESDGERNRLLFVLKSRGTAHSNQVREFVLSEHGIELVDVYIGSSGVLTGSARLAQEAAERQREHRQADELDQRRHKLRRAIEERELTLASVQDELAADRAEMERIDTRETRDAAAASAAERAMVAQRWADPATADGEHP